MKLFGLAVKNIFRNMRRSVLNIVALSLGVAIMVLGLGWVRGYFTTLYGSMMAFDTGQFQILHNQYMKEARRYPLDYRIENYNDFRNLFENIEEVEAVTGRIDFNGKVTKGSLSSRLMVRGIDALHEGAITTIKKTLREGEYLTGRGMLMSTVLAERYEIEVGDIVFLSAVDAYGAENFIDVPIKGLFSYGYPMMDNNMVFVDLDSAAELLDIEGAVTRLVFKTSEETSIEEAMAATNQVLTNSQLLSNTRDGDYAVYHWQRFAETMVSAVKADGGGFIVMIIIMYILIVFNILNSMSMAVKERTRELGTLRAIGMKKKDVRRLILFESVNLAVFSSIIGLFVVSFAVYYLVNVGLNFQDIFPSDLPIPFGEKFHADFRWYDYVTATLIGVLTAIAGSLIPARRAAKLVVADAMREQAL